MDEDDKAVIMIVGAIILLIVAAITVYAFTAPPYRVWSKELNGKAELKQAEWNRQITVEEAAANLEAEKLNAQAEVARAVGVAEANEIIGESLKDNEGYLWYLWVKGLSDGTSEVIYVPTESNLPILEATRNVRE